MFFAKPGIYEPCKLFTIGHFILLAITFIIIGVALYCTKSKNKEDVTKIIKSLTIFLWILEIIKIIFNISIGNGSNPNNYVPLYYCSLILYAGLLSSYGNGVIKKIGDIFIATGAIIGGLFFLISPNTSLPTYPMLHYISIQSFIFHGTMLYLGLLVNITKYVEINIKDIKYYAILICIISAIAYIVNKILNTNFMFISRNFPNTPVEVVYKLLGKYFTIFMIILQVFGPFYVIYGIKKIIIKAISWSKKDKLIEAKN